MSLLEPPLPTKNSQLRILECTLEEERYSHTHTCMHACMHVHMYARTHTHMHARMHARTHARTYARTHACTHACTHTCSMHALMHSRMHTCTHTCSTHALMHSRTHTQSCQMISLGNKITVMIPGVTSAPVSSSTVHVYTPSSKKKLMIVSVCFSQVGEKTSLEEAAGRTQ